MSDTEFTVSESNTEFTDPDIVENFVSSDDSPYRCEVCAAPLVYGGKGRPPVRCSEHKRNKSSGIGKRTSSGNMKALEAAVADMYRALAMGVTMLDTFDGMAIAQGAESLAHSWIVLAETDPKVKKFLVKVTTGSGWGAVIVAHALVALPIIEHHDMMPKILQKSDN